MAKHMTLEERKALEVRYNAGQSVPGIADAMGFAYAETDGQIHGS